MNESFNFSDKLLEYYDHYKRDLPWRGIRDPYKIWLSEIILQQTQVKQALPYYVKITEAFPDVKSLAEADEQDVLVLWQGLGYYSRARNLHAAARYIQNELRGEFPNRYSELIRLKGVGEYTAAAVASIAYGENKAAVDGNVQRIITRIFNITTPIDKAEGKKEIQFRAETLIDKNRAGDFNQAMMDLGSKICKKSNPLCKECPVNNFCEAYAKNTQNELPIKVNRNKQKSVYVNYFCLITQSQSEKSIILRKRESPGIWQQLFDFPSLEYRRKTGIKKIITDFNNEYKSEFSQNNFIIFDKTYKHLLSHRIIHARFFLVPVNETTFKDILSSNSNHHTAKFDNLQDFPKPQLINNFFEDYGNTLF